MVPGCCCWRVIRNVAFVPSMLCSFSSNQVSPCFFCGKCCSPSLLPRGLGLGWGRPLVAMIDSGKCMGPKTEADEPLGLGWSWREVSLVGAAQPVGRSLELQGPTWDRQSGRQHGHFAEKPSSARSSCGDNQLSLDPLITPSEPFFLWLSQFHLSFPRLGKGVERGRNTRRKLSLQLEGSLVSPSFPEDLHPTCHMSK